MRNKMIILLTVFALAAVMAVPAFADVNVDAKTWFEQHFNAKKAAVETAVEEGHISPEQGQRLQEHFDWMYKFHAENGFACPVRKQGMGPVSGFARQGMEAGGMRFGNSASR